MPLSPPLAQCPICGTPEDQMLPYNRRQKVRCPECHSLERHRVFCCAYRDFISHEFDLNGKRILAATPGKAEVRFLSGFGQLVTSDIRPLANRDLQLDLCSMPQVDDASFDCLVMNGIFAHLYDPQAAMREMWRILRPGGRLLATSPHRKNRFSTEIESEEEICKLWGREVFEQYRVGTYRLIGDLGLITELQRFFIVKTFYAADPVTRLVDVVFCGIKSPRPPSTA